MDFERFKKISPGVSKLYPKRQFWIEMTQSDPLEH